MTEQATKRAYKRPLTAAEVLTAFGIASEKEATLNRVERAILTAGHRDVQELTEVEAKLKKATERVEALAHQAAALEDSTTQFRTLVEALKTR